MYVCMCPMGVIHNDQVINLFYLSFVLFIPPGNIEAIGIGTIFNQSTIYSIKIVEGGEYIHMGIP